MTTPAEPVTDALYKALSSPNPDPQVGPCRHQRKSAK